MIKIRYEKQSKSGRWVLSVIFISLLIHWGLFAGGNLYAESAPKVSYDAGIVEFVTPPPPAEPPVPEVEPVPKAEDIPRPEKVRRPRPNTAAPEPEPETPPAKPVFGVTADSLAGGDSGVSVRVGNTLEKEMEKEAPPKNVAPLASVKEPPDTPVSVEELLKPVPVYSLSKSPGFKTKVEPVYPKAAREADVEGVVELEVLIDARGMVRKIKVLSSPGYKLERAAIIAVSKSVFTPGMVGGKAVPVKIKIPYRFVLDS
ncbi:MAG: TonB family protein [Deltaproteobacteria bacterium]|nr:TonB family protein [Deltaproteobacteria bacterium]